MSAAVAAAFSVVVGCHREQPASAPDSTDAEPAEAEAVPEFEDDPVQKLFMEASRLFETGATNETVSLMANAIEDENLAFAKPQILQALVRLHIEIGDIEAARNRVFDVYRSGDEVLSEAVLGSIFYTYVNTGDVAAALDWADSVLALDSIAPQVRRMFVDWSLSSAIDIGDDARVGKSMLDIIAAEPTGEQATMLRRSMETLIARGKVELLSSILAKVGEVNGDMANTITVMKLRVSAQLGNWDAVVAGFSAAAGLPDRELQYALRNTIPVAEKAARQDKIEEICANIVNSQNVGPLAFTYAARQWVDCALKRSPLEVPQRISQLMERNGFFVEIAHVFIRHAYDDIDDMAFTKPMKGIGERLLDAAGDNLRSSLRTILLDYSFLVEDYDAALALLAERIGDYDDNWHTMATAKVKAHKALKEGRSLDAVREFRAFMEVIANSSDNETSDPATGVIHTREMILGRNAARIGDIYASIADEDHSAEAAAAYAEARDYFNKALETVTDEATIAVIRKELGAIDGK